MTTPCFWVEPTGVVKFDRYADDIDRRFRDELRAIEEAERRAWASSWSQVIR